MSAAAFLEEAVLRPVDDAHLEDDEIQEAAQAGIAAIAAGHYTTVATSQDALRLQEQMIARVRDRLRVKEQLPTSARQS